MIKKFDGLPLLTKIGQVILFISIVIFFAMVISRGIFTTFLAFYGVVIAGIISAVLSLTKKNYIIAIVDIMITLLIFIIFSQLPA